MDRKGLYRIALLSFFVLGITGCRKAMEVEAPQYDRQLPPGQYALRKITDPAMIPGISLACYDTVNLRRGIDHSLSYLSKPSSKQFFPMGDITHEQSVASLRAIGDLLDQGLRGKELQSAILARFDFYQSVGCDDKGTVLFTGYYTPIFDGSLTPDARYRYPLYKQPDDLVKGPNGEILGRKMTGGAIVAYPSRREIEQSGMLKGQEVAWMADPFEVYIAHVQGSARLRLPDGKLVTMGYAANNGHEYNSVAQEMIRDQLVPASGMSLKAMIDYFKAHPDKIDMYIQRNPRYVFFRVDQGDPRGSLNEPVIAMRTIATDKSIYPRACLSFLKTVLPRPVGYRIVKAPYTGFVLDQDTGGAIRAPGRCDVYMGVGDQAGEMAGQVYEEGQLYYLFVKTGTPSLPVPIGIR
jgi:membrane-bound lytic murein transglycosylase A